MDGYLNKLLHLPNAIVEYCLEIEEHVVLQLKLVNEGILCPNCGQKIDKINQTEYSLIRDLSIVGKPVFLRVPRRQFHCLNCEKYSTERLEFMDWKHPYTRRYEAWIYEQVKKTNIEQVSREESLSASTIQHIFNQMAEDEIKKRIGVKQNV